MTLRQVTSIEELKALEDPEVILVDCKLNAYQWGIGLDGSEGWQSTRDPNPITSHHLWRFAPLMSVHIGNAVCPPNARDLGIITAESLN